MADPQVQTGIPATACRDCGDKSGTEMNSAAKIVFLTFDDGLTMGTQEIYNVLTDKEVQVPATFFLTGAHVQDYIHLNPSSDLLERLFHEPDFDVGNHSNSHANQDYPS